MRNSILILAFVTMAATPLAAATRTWSGAAGATWSNPANWDGTAPVAGDDLVFPDGAVATTTTNDFPDGTAFHSFTVNGSDYVLGGHRVLLGAGGVRNIAPMPNTFTLDITLAADEQFTGGTYTGAIDLGGHALVAAGTFNGPISGEGSLACSSGFLTLVGANTYTGPTTVSNTYLSLGGPSPFGAGDGTAENGTKLVSNVLIGRSTDTYAVGNEHITIGSNVRFSGSATLGGPVTLTGSTLYAVGSLTINGPFTSAGDALALDGCGTLTLGSAHNSFKTVGTLDKVTCTTRLRLGIDNALPPATLLQYVALDLNGFSATIAGITPPTMNSSFTMVELHGGTLTLNGPSPETSYHLSGGLNGPGTVIINGGTFRFSGIPSGSFVVNGGHLLLAGKQDGSVTVTNGILSLCAGSYATRIVASGGTVGAGEMSEYFPSSPDPRCDTLELGPNVTYIRRRTLHVSGNVDLGGAHLQPQEQLYGVVIYNDGTEAVRGTFAGLPEGGLVHYGEAHERITYKGGTGNDVLVALLPSPSMTLTSDVNPATAAQPITFTATVRGTGPAPTGTVSFSRWDGHVSARLGTVALGPSGVVHVTATLPIGTHMVDAYYSGDGEYNGKGATIEQQNVVAAPALGALASMLVAIALAAVALLRLKS